MATKICKNGHTFEKTSDCPVCPICSSEELKTIFEEGFPKIGAPASRALAGIGVKKLSDLTRFSKKQLIELHGFGPKALRILTEAIAKSKLSFKD